MKRFKSLRWWLAGVAILSAPQWVGAQNARDVSRRLDELDKRLQSIEASLQKLAGGAPAPAPIPVPAAAPAPGGKPKLGPKLNSEAGVAAATPEDTDKDGLTNAEEAALGTDPANPDTDGDALLDGWEVHGVNGLDLAAAGALPRRKDIFVEMDFMKRASATNELGPNTAVLNQIRDIFASALVRNHDGSRGISIHLELGNEVPLDPDLNPAATEFSALKGIHFEPDRAPVYHYMIWADKYDGGTSSGNSFDIPNSDFIVTLGGWNGGAGGTNLQKVGTFSHELGHNLGLKHGGSDHVHRKPSHLSVMNYLFQTSGVKVGSERRFGYQPFATQRLNEASLLELFGLGGGPELTGYHTIVGGVEVPAHASIDWNRNGTIDSAPVTVDLNNDFQFNTLQGSPDEWNSLVYNGGSVGTVRSLGVVLKSMNETRQLLPFVELTEEMDKALKP